MKAMGFVPISVDNFIKMHLESNPSDNENNLRVRLSSALADYQNGVKCECGNDIWVIGSAFGGNSCYTCFTGKSAPTDDFEIESALKKRGNIAGQRHIDVINPHEISGYFTDEGYEINMDLIRKPTLCLSCIYNDDPAEEILCNLNRIDQQDETEFVCHSYRQINT